MRIKNAVLPVEEQPLLRKYWEKLTDSVVESLLSSGKIKLKGCKSAKTGRTFDAMLLMEVDENGKINFSMEFENGRKKR